MRRVIAGILFAAGRRVVGFGLLLYWLGEQVSPSMIFEVMDVEDMS